MSARMCKLSWTFRSVLVLQSGYLVYINTSEIGGEWVSPSFSRSVLGKQGDAKNTS